MPRSPIIISAIIACYRDQQAIPIMHHRLTTMFKRLKIGYEIIFVNDGSPDDSERVLQRLARQDRRVVVITHSRNFGSQMAFTSGMQIARGQAVVLMDGDLQDPPELIPEFYYWWKKGFDVVYGVRVKRDEPMVMQFFYKLFYRLFSTLSYIRIPVDAGDFSLIDRKVVNAINQLPERDRFIRGLRAWVGFQQRGVPYERPKRMFGTSTNNLLKNFRWAIKGIFAFSDAPLQAITLLSLAVFVVSVVGIIYQIIFKITHPHDTPNGVTTILVVVLFLGAVQLLSLSILGEYLGKIFEEVKQRPHFIVKRIHKRS